MEPVNRQVLMIEVDGLSPEYAAERVREALDDARVWVLADPTEVGAMALQAELVAA